MKVFTNIVIVPNIRETGKSSLETLQAYRFERIIKQGLYYFSARLPRGWYTVEKGDQILFKDEAGTLMFIAFTSEDGKPFIYVIREPQPVKLDQQIWSWQ